MTGFHRLIALGVALLILTLTGLALHISGEGTVGTPERKVWFVALLGLAALVHFGAIATVRRGVPKRAVWIVVTVAIAVRVGPLLEQPFLSSDVYRYAWDGRVQADGINPYAYVPADPALSALRDQVVFPHINRAETTTTIYPPAAQAVFAAVGVTHPPGVTAIKAAMIAFEMLAIGAAFLVLRRIGRHPAWIVVWAWNPLAIWAFAGNGHIDAVAAGFLGLALLLAPLRGGVFAGIAFGFAVLTKFLPLVVAPALWPRGGWRAAGMTIVTMTALYACYAGAGWRVLGSLSVYSREEGLSDGTGIWLLAGLGRIVTLPSFARELYVAAAAAALGALALWIAVVRRPMTDAAIWRAAGWLMASATIVASPHYPWYFVWLALPAIVAPSRMLIWLSTAPVLLYLDPLNEQFLWPSLVYLPAFALAVADAIHPLDKAPSVSGVAPPQGDGAADVIKDRRDPAASSALPL